MCHCSRANALKILMPALYNIIIEDINTKLYVIVPVSYRYVQYIKHKKVNK